MMQHAMHREHGSCAPYASCHNAGMRMRVPESPLLGVMWVDPGRDDPLNNIRHEALQRDGGLAACLFFSGQAKLGMAEAGHGRLGGPEEGAF